MLTRLPLATLLLGVAAFTSGCALTSEAAKSAPAITSVSPNSALGGSQGFTLTVDGANFQPNSVVLWNGAARTTTFNSKIQLQAAIPSSDVAQVGTVEISVLTPPFKTNTSKSFPFVIASQLQITTSNLPNAMAKKPYDAPLSDSGGVPPFTWSVSSGHLPPGLAMTPLNGVISGMATSTGSYPFTAQVKDSGAKPQSASKNLTLSVVSSPSTLLISTTILPTGTVQAAYNATLAAFGGQIPYSWSVISGAPPAGISLNASTGVLSGTPTQTGGFTFTIQVKDSESTPQTASNTFSISINNLPNPPPQITTSSLPGGQVKVAYNTLLAASGGTTPYIWSVTTGSLPAGLLLNSSTGAISGIPSASGTFTFTVQARDSSSPPQTATKILSISVAPAVGPSLALTITTSNLPSGTVNVSYSTTLAAIGGTTPYSWSVTSSLPGGLTIDSSTGAISGMPNASGTFTFAVQATDSSPTPQTASKQLSIAIAAAAPSPVSITNTSLPGGTAQASYSASLTASGGTTPYSWTITVGSLPAGLSLNGSTGAISGTPTASGTATFTAQVKDSSATQQSASKQLSINISAVAPPPLSITTSSLPSGQVNVSYNATLAASGGTAPYSWSITAGSLPSGLSPSSSTGAISGMPSASGTFTFTVQATDSSSTPQTASKQLSINISAAAPSPLSITTSSLPSGQVNVSYNATLAASGGTTPYSWSVTGSLPGGLSLNSSTGAINGTPSASGTFTFTVQARDSSSTPQTASKQLSINISAVAPPPLSITTSSLPSGQVNVSYNATLAASGGTAPYSWSVSAGALPGGLSPNSSTGAISGMPSASGAFTFTVQTTDSSSTPQTASKQLSINISAAAPPPLSITTSSLPSGQVNVSYNATLAASGGTTPYSWSVTGSLPGGLSPNSSTGAISGTPSASGAFTFTVQATDSSSTPQTASKQLSINIAAVAPPPLSITTSSLPSDTVNVSYNSTLSATGGVSPYTWSLSSGTLPNGLTLAASTGVISGTPSLLGSFRFGVKVADSAASLATATFSITIVSPTGPPVAGASRGYVTTPGELATIATKAASSIQPYADAVLSVENYANTGSASASASSPNPTFWPYGTISGSIASCASPEDPAYIRYGAPLIEAKAETFWLTGNSQYAADVRTHLLDLVGTTTWGGENYSGGNQCILNLTWFMPGFIHAADLIEGYSGWSAADKTSFQNWLATEVYKKVDWAEDAHKNNWGASGAAASATIADYLIGSGILMVDRFGATINSHDAYQEAKQRQFDRVDGNSYMEAGNCPVSYPSIRADGGQPQELARGSSGCDALWIVSLDPSYTYTMTGLQGLIQHAELLLRRGDSSLFDHVAASTNTGSLHRAVLFLLNNPNDASKSVPWLMSSAGSELEIVYRYYRDTFAADQLGVGGSRVINPDGGNSRMNRFGTLTHGFNPSENPGPPPTVAAP